MSKLENKDNNKMISESVFDRNLENSLIHTDIPSKKYISKDNETDFLDNKVETLERERKLLFFEDSILANTEKGQDFIITGTSDSLFDDDGKPMSIVQWGALFDGHGLIGRSFGIPEFLRKNAKSMLSCLANLISKEYMEIDYKERSNYVCEKIQSFVDDVNNKSYNLIGESVKSLLGDDIDRTGSTMVITIITEDGNSHIGWLGDSTCCIFKGENLFWKNEFHKPKIPVNKSEIKEMTKRYDSGGYGCSEFATSDNFRSRMEYTDSLGYHVVYEKSNYNGYCVWKNVPGNRLACNKSLGHCLVRKSDLEFSKISFESFELDNTCKIMMFSDGVSDMIPNIESLHLKTAEEVKDLALLNWHKPIDVYYKSKIMYESRSWSNWDDTKLDYIGRDDISVIVFSPCEERIIKRRRTNRLAESEKSDDMNIV